MLTGDREIAAVKQKVFGYAEATDVIALRYAPTPTDPAAEAELFINVERAFRHPRWPGWTPARELALYIAHGFDHLAGANDDTPTARLHMRRRELRWLRQPDISERIAHLRLPDV